MHKLNWPFWLWGKFVGLIQFPNINLTDETWWISGKLPLDANDRFKMTKDGLFFGSGVSDFDTTLGRTAAGTLSINGNPIYHAGNISFGPLATKALPPNDGKIYGIKGDGSYAEPSGGVGSGATIGVPTQLWDNAPMGDKVSSATAFTTSGGTCFFDLTVCMYCTVAGVYGYRVLVDGAEIGIVKHYFNEAYSHKTISRSFVKALAAGSHTIQLAALGTAAATNAEDTASLVIVEYKEAGSIRFDEYSTIETRTDKLLNGKPVYRRLVTFGTMPNNATKRVAHGAVGVESWLPLTGSLKLTSGGVISFPFIDVNNTAPQIQGTISGDSIVVTTKSSWYAPGGGDPVSDSYFVIEYTKTADATITPTPSGWVQDDVFSLTETLTNKVWFGKKVYRKVVACGALANTSYKDTAHGVTGYDMIRLDPGDSYAKDASGNVLTLPYAGTSITASVTMLIVGASIRIQTGMDRSSYTTTYVTVEYTKN